MVLLALSLLLLAVRFLEAGATVIAVYDPSCNVSQCIDGSDYQYKIDNLPGHTNNTLQIRICSSQSLLSNKTITLSQVSNVTKVGSCYYEECHKLPYIEPSLKSSQESCAPGFIQNQTNKDQCICSLDTVGIKGCNYSLIQAYRSRGYWIGYDSRGSDNEHSLLSGYCPPSFCSSIGNLLLPSAADREKLNQIVCSNLRTGTLCGRCKENYTVYYHSFQFQCKLEKNCELGWLFYILSEIVPVTCIFITIIIFNIPFTSGVINGFVFYAQVVEILQMTAGDFISYPPVVYTLTRIHFFLYSFFNLNTFVLEEISFCIWKGANALDMIAFGYVTLAYSLVLIVVTVTVLNKCSCKSNVQHGGIIHGLSAFLVLSYAQCARTSIFLISPINLYQKDPDHSHSVVYYNGEINWISREHLPYAIPAILMFTLIVVAPPIILLFYPLHYKILSALHIAESSYVKTIFNPLEKLKPFLDSFQGCFKDEYRFFSGLYFVYRFMFLFNSTMTLIEVVNLFNLFQLSIMLILHAACHPYKERLHNVIDALLFGNLALVNAITLYIFSVRNYENPSINSSNIPWVKLMLIFLPLLFMPVYLVAKVSSVKNFCKKLFYRKRNEVEDDGLPARLTYGALRNGEDKNIY